MNSNQKRSRVFYGWYIVAACALITLYTGGIVNFGFTAVFEPLANEFGWSYAQIALAASLRGLEMGLLAPFVGLFVDRWGPRRLIFAGSILVCLGFLLLSRVSSLLMFYASFLLIASGMSTCAGTVLTTAVANWFHKRAGIASGIVVSGFGMGGLLVPVVTRLIDVFQWRMAMVIVGLGMLVTVLPLSLLVRHKPEHYGFLPDGEVSSAVETGDVRASAASTEVNIPASQALRSRAFWHVALASLCHAFVVNAIVMHIMPYLSSIGIPRTVSSLAALVLPLLSISGRLGSGWLSDRLGSKKVFTASFILMTVGLLLFGNINASMMWLLVLFIVTFSLGWGCSVTTRLSLQREYFGRGSFGAINGFLSGVMMVGNISGAPLAGLAFDTWGSYRGAWLGFAALTIVGMVLAVTMPSTKKTIRMPDGPGIKPQK
ncbi:MAG: MFS transporter [Chloroflexi bacterium]|nr:MFS transporter [Chloroflexota bacterium]